jgi:O-antigen/teichoic acid export membrane protein
MKQKINTLLSRLGSYIKTDVSYIIKGSFWLSISTVVGTISAFALVLAFGNFVSPEIYGTYRFFLSYASIFGLFALAGFGGATTRAVAKGFEGEVLRSYKLKTLGALVGSLVALVFSAYYFWNDNTLLGFGFVIIGIALPFMEPPLIYNAFLSGKKQFKRISNYSVISYIVATSLLLAGIFVGFGPVELLATYFVGWAGTRLFFFFYTIRKLRPNKKIGADTKKLGTHLTSMGILNHIMSALDKIAIFHFLGAIEVAVYSFAIAATEQAKGLFKNTNTLALPRFSERSEGELKKTMLRKMVLMSIAVAAFVIPFIIFAPLLFETFLPKYMSSVFPARIFSLSLIGVVASLPASAMKSLSKIKGLYFYNITLSVLGIVLIIVLTSMYGIIGTVLARLITRVSGIFLSLFAFYLL